MVGDLGNDPDNLPELQLGSRVVIDEALISDWMYQSREGIYGGYTMRVMIEDMSPADAAPYRASLAPTLVPPTWVP